MTHYSRRCLHLGCGEPLGRVLPVPDQLHKQDKNAAVSAKKKTGKNFRRETTKHK